MNLYSNISILTTLLSKLKLDKFALQLVLILIIIINNNSYLFTQTIENELPKEKMGIYAGYNLNFHSTDFSSLPSVPNCCVKFSYAFGSGFSYGILYDYVLNKSSGLEFRLGFSRIDGTFSERNVIGNTWLRNSNPLDTNRVQIANVNVDHEINANIFNIVFLPSYRYSAKNFNLTGGLKLGYINSSSFNQKEVLISPENVVFENLRLSRNEFEGDKIPEVTSVLFGVNLGISYDINLSKKWIIAPELRYEINLNSINSNPWKVSTAAFGAALKYNVFEKITPKELPIKEETIYQRDTIIVENIENRSIEVKMINQSEKLNKTTFDDYILHQKVITENYQKNIPKILQMDCNLEIAGLLPDGTKQTIPTITIEETEVNESFPILPHIFFKENSSDLSATGMNLLQQIEAEKFKENELEKSTLKLYDNMLNIIGYRLKYNPKAKIKIIGTNKNKDIELNNLELSNNRAIAIKNYLTEVWAVNPNRIEVTKRNLPQNPGNNNLIDGEIENQRAEIYCNDFEILKPINIKTIEKSSNPPILLIGPKFKKQNENTLLENVNWDLNISQNEKFLRRTTSDIEKDGVFRWNILDEPSPLIEDQINIKLKAENEYGGICEFDEKINIKQLTIRKKRFELKDDYKIEKYSLIVFDFDQSKLTEQHKDILNEIKQKIEPNSKVKIYGYTDKIGDENYNEILAGKRANEVQSFLKVKQENLELKSIGSNDLLYDNSTPQGRSFCRTVLVQVETPIK